MNYDFNQLDEAIMEELRLKPMNIDDLYASKWVFHHAWRLTSLSLLYSKYKSASDFLDERLKFLENLGLIQESMHVWKIVSSV